MASRPIFFPNFEGERLVVERFFEFTWASGFAESQKKKNVQALHDAAKKQGISNILEISTKSAEEIGRRLSAFSLKIDIDGAKYPLESVYQGSKKFENGGPFENIFSLSPRDAKRYIRDADCGRLVEFKLQGKAYPLSPKNAFYDWLYIRSLIEHAQWIDENVNYDAFTDIEFNPSKQVNCQARAFAEFVSLFKRSKLEEVGRDFDIFSSMLTPI